MHLRYTTLSALAIVLALQGCGKKEIEGPQGPAGPAGPSFTGAITGHVSVFDQYGSRVLYNYNPIRLTLGSRPAVTADSAGFFHFDTVATGSYKLSVTGEAIGGTVLQSVLLKDTLYQPVKVSRKPSFILSGFTASRISMTSEISLDMSYAPDNRTRMCIVFVGKGPDVSGDPATYSLAYTRMLNVNTNFANLRIPAADLNNARLFYGDLLYFAAYSYVINDASVYPDPVTGRNFYTAIDNRITDTAWCP